MGFDFDHAVVGGGIVGSWTAYHLRKLGKNVLLLEKFSHPHSRGSSHGQSRLTRSCYEETFFAEMMPHAHALWRQAETESQQTLMHNSGVLCLATSNEDMHEFHRCVFNMQTFCPEEMDVQDPKIAQLMSSALKYDSLWGCLMDKTGGVIMAHRAVLAIQNLFRANGGQLWDDCPVQKIEPLSDSEVRIVIDGKPSVSVRSVVVCAGAWTKGLLSPLVDLPLQAQAVRVYYWREKEEGVYSLKNGFPALLDVGQVNVYVIPSCEYPGLVKICKHGGVNCDPDLRDRTPQSPDIETSLKEYVREHFPLLDPEPAIVETCMYTVTPDEIFLVDTVPGHTNIVFGTGFSGTGFKTSPVIGRILSELATDQKPFLDTTPLRLSRF